MTQPTEISSPASGSPSPAIPDAFACQNGDGNPYAVIIARPGVSETDFLCDSCNLAMWLAVLQEAARNGTIQMDPPGQ